MNEPEPQEPSVLDYIKSRLLSGGSQKVELVETEKPFAAAEGGDELAPPPPANGRPITVNISFQLPQSLPWRTFVALLLAIFAQFTLDPTGLDFGPKDLGGALRDTDFHRAAMIGAIFYGIAALFLVWAYVAREFRLPALPDDDSHTDPMTMRVVLLIVAGVLSLLAFLSFTDLFNVTNVTLWLAGLAFYLRSLWLHERRPVSEEDGQILAVEQPKPVTLGSLISKWWDVALLLLLALWGVGQPNIFLCGLVPFLIALTIIWLRDPNAILSPVQQIKAFFSHSSWQINITRWALLVIAIIGLVTFFRLYRLDGVLAEPFSDQAEKLLDVFDVTQGQTAIFFPRNSGREFLQFYWTALMGFLFGTGLTFQSLKIGTALIGMFALPYIYLLGKEIGGKRVALFALALAGVAYWLNVSSRVGLRFPLYPAFVAPTLYYLVKGLRTQKRNQFIMAGIFLGLGLHGYSPFRIVPFVAIAAVLLYLLHKPSAGRRKQVLILSSILVLTSVLVFSPLGHYAMEHPDAFSTRAFSRLTESEQLYPVTEHCAANPDQKMAATCIFFENTYNAMMMFFWDNGSIWVHSVPGRPALDVASAVLFGFGYVLLLIRYIHKRRWQDLFLVISVPLLLMPSILSLAFPGENPSLNRTGGAGVAVFVIAAVALDGIYISLRGERSGALRRMFALSTVVILLGMATFQNFDLLFNKFDTEFRAGIWNVSDMSKVMKAFMTYGNSPDNAWVVGFPYWVDTRLVGIQAGLPTKDFAIWPDQIAATVPQKGAKLFIVKDEDASTLTLLHQLYPTGQESKFDSPLEGKDFWIYSIPDSQGTTP